MRARDLMDLADVLVDRVLEEGEEAIQKPPDSKAMRTQPSVQPKEEVVVKVNSVTDEPEPGSGSIRDDNQYVMVAREELQGMLQRQEELEAMVKADRNEHRRQQGEMEAKINALITRNEGEENRPTASVSASTSFVPPAVKDAYQKELAPLVGPIERLEIEECQPEDLQEEEEWHAPFGKSVYTLLYMCEASSQGFRYGVFVSILQQITILLTLIGILDLDAEENKLALPAQVDAIVTATQGVTIFLALAFQSEIIEAVLKLQEGYHPEVLEKHPGATKATWLISCLTQLVAGLLLIATIFILTMQSEDVLSIMLNFAALHFMAEIDDLGFGVAKMGFVTNEIQKEANSVLDFQVPKRKTLNRCRRILYLLTLVALFAGYGALKKKQLDGEYLPTYIYVQFGDAYNSKIPYYSGILRSESKRTAYRRTYRDTGTQNILLAYCDAEKAWAFTENNKDPCDYFARSAETTSYDVTSIPDSEWQVKDSFLRLQPFDSFSLVSRDCNRKTCQGDCADDGLCQCRPNQFGMDCEFMDVCPELVTDARFEDFPAVKFIPSSNPRRDFDASAVSSAFLLLKNPDTGENVRVYNMPVYYSNQTFPANLIFFGGRRWIITSEWDLFNLTQVQIEHPNSWFFVNQTVSTLENKFHGYHQAYYTPLFISDPVDFATPNFLPTPTGLQWWLVKKTGEAERLYTPDAAVGTILTCQAPPFPCPGQGEYFCQNEGTCNSDTGFCDCPDDFEGDRCELEVACYEAPDPCNHNGICDHGSGASEFCRCNFPWYGKLCKEWYKCYEDLGSCLSGGVCDMATGDCDCPDDPAISGHSCEKRADCTFFGCANGGHCAAWQGDCICRPPFHGTLCELVDTQSALLCSRDEDCMDGSCNVQTGLCTCHDPASYGALCEHRFDCTEITKNYAQWQPPCQNHGTCNDATGICECPHPYFGPECSQVPPCTSNDECDYRDSGGFGGGSCNLESGRCECALGPAAGKRCEAEQWCFTNEDCSVGSCEQFSGTCKCPAGSSGRFCETLVVGMYPTEWDDEFEVYKEAVLRCGFDKLFNYEDKCWSA